MTLQFVFVFTSPSVFARYRQCARRYLVHCFRMVCTFVNVSGVVFRLCLCICLSLYFVSFQRDNEVCAGRYLVHFFIQYNLPICLCELLHLTLSQSRALITLSDMLVDPVHSGELLLKSPNWKSFGNPDRNPTQAAFGTFHNTW